MPIVRYQGKDIKIPFDPENIAKLLYSGIEVIPESDISDEQRELEFSLIDRYLRKLWGKQELRIIPERHPPDPSWPKSMPESGLRGWGQEDGWGGVPGYNPEHDFLKVIPNPTIEYNIREINQPSPITLLEAKTRLKRKKIS